MKATLALLTITFMSSPFSSGNILEASTCHAQSKTHKLLLSNAIDGVEFLFEEIAPEDLGKIPGSNLKVSGSTLSRRLIHGVRLAELSHKPSAISESLVSIMRSRPEFDGDADMHYAYAGEYLRNMNCK